MTHALSRYADDGFAFVPGVFSRDEIALMCEVMAELEACAKTRPTPDYSFERAAPGVLRRTFRPLDLAPALAFLLEHRALLDVIAECVGPDIEFYGSKVVWKPPHGVSNAPWHQDLAYFQHSNANLVTASIHLDDFTDGEGVLRFVSGYHRGPVLRHVKGELEADEIAKCEARGVDGSVGLGELTLHHSLTPHGSRQNRGRSLRKRLLLVFRSSDCVSLEEPLLEIYGSHSGRLVRGQPRPRRDEGIVYPDSTYAD